MSDYTDALKNKLAPDQQIAPIIAPQDQILEADMVLAEQVGLNILEHTAGSVASGDTDRFTDTTNSPFSIADIGRYIRIKSGGSNDGLFRVVAFVDASNVDCVTPNGSDPAFSTETAITYAIHEEPNLEHSLDYMLTQMRNIIDPASDWFASMPKALNPCDTDASNTKKETMSLKAIADGWYGTRTKIIDVATASIAVADTDTGKLFATALKYGDLNNNEGFIIQSSVANAGTYKDEIALASIIIGKHKVILIDDETGAEFRDNAGNLIYGVLQDGADHAGTGNGTDIFIKFVHDVGGTPTAYTWTAFDPSSISAYLPQRKCTRNLNEYDERVFKSAGIVGDAEMSDDVNNVRRALGIGQGDNEGDFDLTNTGNFYAFSELTLSTATMEDIVNKLNEEVGSRDYTQNNLLVDGETISESLDKLDQAISSAGLKSKIYERVTSDIAKGVAHTIPFASGSDAGITSYKLDTNHFARYMSVHVAGKKLVPDSSAVATDGEYEETSNTQVTFRFRVRAGQIIEYIISDEG